MLSGLEHLVGALAEYQPEFSSEHPHQVVIPPLGDQTSPGFQRHLYVCVCMRV